MISTRDLPASSERMPDDVTIGEVRAFIAEVVALLQGHLAADQRSASGGQLEALRLGMITGTLGGWEPWGGGTIECHDDGHLERRTHTAEDRLEYYGIVLAFWNRRLDENERRVLVAHNTPVGTSERFWEVPSGSVDEWCRRGARMVGAYRDRPNKQGLDVRVHAAPGCVFLMQQVPVYPHIDEVARTVSLAPWKVRDVLGSATAKVRVFICERISCS